MASINYGAREISVKIVYYGPGLSGKTTNLQIIHKKVPPEHKSDMVSLATETDRTLFFDFLPLDLGTIKGFSTKFQLYTVPGQVYYNATRKLVLRNVDGVVFVADSAPDKIPENLESFQNLEDNLAQYNYKREELPIVIQYNKRDIPNALSVEELQMHVNKYGLPYTEAIANKGTGVFDTLKLMGKLVIDNLNKRYSKHVRPGTAVRPAAAPGAAPAAPRPVAPAPQPMQPMATPTVQQHFAPPPPPPAPTFAPQAPVAPAPTYGSGGVTFEPIPLAQSAPAPAAPMAPVQPPRQQGVNFPQKQTARPVRAEADEHTYSVYSADGQQGEVPAEPSSDSDAGAKQQKGFFAKFFKRDDA